ncbi:MAG: response regulator [Planctomycetia bacterium]|nr:response regulator [Planctomycetia bacterium]
MSASPPPLPLLLLVEDEVPMRRFLRTFLSGSGYRIQEAGTGQQALTLAAQAPPDLVLLDLGLPDMDGQEVLRRLRQWLKAPIIILSVRDQDVQKITALDSGADDYLTKPFSSGELLARVRVALRRAKGGSGGDPPVFESGGLKVDQTARKVSANQVEVHLTPIEYKLLVALVQHCGQVVTHHFLLQEVWGPKRALSTQHLRVFMAGLRRKIEVDPAQPRLILTEQGVGYRLVSE